MCGIIGYIGPRKAKDVLMDGLKRLEYRGYDSAGLAVVSSDMHTSYLKEVGKVSALTERVSAEQEINGSVGIAHTRWATHGGVTRENAHPHTDENRRVFVVHNGIIENYRDLRRWLQERGVSFTSDTDTEVLAQLLGYFVGQGYSSASAVNEALRSIRGAYGVVIVFSEDPDTLYAARNGSPLILGVGNEEFLVASDLSALVVYTRHVIHLKDGELATVMRTDFTITDKHNQVQSRETEELPEDIGVAHKNGYPHFMKKEIYEQSEALANVLSGRIDEETGNIILGGIDQYRHQLAPADQIIIVSCGTSYYAGLVGQHLIEELAHVPVRVEIASEFRYRTMLVTPQTVVVAVSQSGETADTIAALQEVELKGATLLGIVNVVGSTIARMTHAGIYTHAGQEIGVASTKAFTSQLGALLTLAMYLGRQRTLDAETVKQLSDEVFALIEEMPAFIARMDEETEALATRYEAVGDMLYLGRGYGYPIALEGALKLKEISYVHAEGYASGEMKHGPIALVDENFPTVALACQDPVYTKTLSNIQEIKARNGPVIAVATEGDTEIADLADEVMYVPSVSRFLLPLVAVIPYQLFAYHIAVRNGKDPDKPRNLAKSVTVE